MSTLYDLSGEYLTLLDMLEDPEADPELIRDTMDAVGGEFEAKAENYAKVLRQMKADADGITSEIQRLMSRLKANESGQDRLKDILYQNMKITGKRKFKTELFSFNIQRNPPHIVYDYTELNEVPEKYLIPQPPKIDTKTLKEDIKAGDKATVGVAHIEQSEGVRIR